jgi:NAD(P)H-flavin reductase
MQTDGFRAWRKTQKTFDLRSQFGQVQFYGVFIWLPLWTPALAAAAFLCPAALRGALPARWSTGRLLGKRFSSVSPSEAAGALLLGLAALAWFLGPLRRSYLRRGLDLKGQALSAGLAAVPLLAALLVPANAGEAVVRMLGVPPEHAVAYHRWIGFFAVLLLSLHGAGYITAWASQEGWTGVYERLLTLEHCTSRTKICLPAGLVAVTAGLVMGLAASAALRRRSWLFFRATHVIGSPMFFLAGCMHWPSLVWWLVPSLALHFAKVADRLCQGLLSVPAVSALEQPSSGRGAAVRRKAVRIKLPQLLGHVQPGQWVGVGLPGLLSESHPCTLMSPPGAPQAEVLLHLNGSSRLAQAATRQAALSGGYWAPQTLRLRGPYGGIPPLDKEAPTLLVAGGSGITTLVGLLAKDSSSHSAQRHLCWSLRGDVALLQAMKAHITSEDLGASVTVHATAEYDMLRQELFEDPLAPTADELRERERAAATTGTLWRPLAPAESNPLLANGAACFGATMSFLISSSWVEHIKISAGRRAVGPAQLVLACIGSLATAVAAVYSAALIRQSSGCPSSTRPFSRYDMAPGISEKNSDEILRNGDAEAQVEREPFMNGDLLGAGGAQRAEVVRGRPRWGPELDRLASDAPPGSHLDVVVSGPQGMVDDLRRACAGHPLAWRIRFQACSFSL